MINLNLINNSNSSMCSECGGACCKRKPGIYTPEQFESISYDSIKELLDSGTFAIDWWEDDTPIYFIRPRIKGEPAIYGSWGGECINLTSKGCSLDFKDRPHACQTLVPNLISGERKCYDNMKGKDRVGMWLPYQKQLNEIVDTY